MNQIKQADPEQQADIFREQVVELAKKVAEEQQKALQLIQRWQAERQRVEREQLAEDQRVVQQKERQAEQERLAEAQKNALLERQQEEAQLNFCETATTYCTDLKYLYDSSPANFKFGTIRSLTSDCGVWQQLGSGVNQLQTYEQLSQYVFSYGLMHQAKLRQAYHSIFSNNHLQLNGQTIEIIDYGCGQGIGTICLVDYIKEKTNCNCSISNVKLIEPSELALKRAVLNVRYSLKSFDQQENIVAINKELNDISSEDIETYNDTIKMHIFSNIIDVNCFDLDQLYDTIKGTQRGINIFICVSPNIMPSRNQRLDNFQGYFECHSSFVSISNRETDILSLGNSGKPYKRYERIFRVTL